MKKIFILIAMLAMVTPILEAKVTYYPGTIRYKNGDTEEYSGIVIPGCEATTVTVTNDPKHKEKEKIDTREIFSIDLWHKDHPDKVGHLYPIVINKGKGTVVRICLLEHASNWGAVLELADYYYIDKKGQLYGVVISTNNAPPTIRHYLVRNGEEKGTLLFTNRSWNPRRAAAAEHFAENPDIAERINSGKLKTTDINYILDAMDSGAGSVARSEDDDEDEDERPARKSSASAKSSHKSSSNGFDNDYEMHKAVRVDYMNFFSTNQLVMLGFEYNKSVVIAGARIGAVINNELDFQNNYDPKTYVLTSTDTTQIRTTTLGVGLVVGVRLPFQVGDYYLIPRITVSPTILPLSLIKGNAKMAAEIPFSAGLDFAIPVSEYAFNLGLSFAYDLSICAKEGDRVATKANSGTTLRQQLGSNSNFGTSLFGQPALGVHVAFCW